MSNASSNSPDRPSSVRKEPAASVGGSSVSKSNPINDEPTTITRPPVPVAPTDNALTIISGKRPRTSGPDSQLLESLSGRKLGHFELMESVGVGGMAAVIRARDLDLARIVALKILPPDMAVDPENVIRFKQEGRAAAKLDHDNIARVYYCGEDQGLHFIAFEFVEGETLRAVVERRGGMLPVSEAVSYLTQITAGLVHAASRSVVHRDIKPSNLIITPEGRAKIVDMGLARNLDSQGVNGGVTQSGVTLGTFDYISPEQAIEPRLADTRSDIYSLGCTFYHVLTGVVPVPEGTAAKKLHAHQHLAPVDPRILNPGIPDELVAIIGRMMAKEPENRYQTPEHLLQHLLGLAERLHLPVVGGVKLDSTKSSLILVDSPLPKPPTLSPLWIGSAVVGLIILVIAVSGGFTGADKEPLERPPLWADKESIFTRKSTEIVPNNLPNPQEVQAINREARTANNTLELITLLNQNYPKIQLIPGTVYDLTQRLKIDLPEAIFQGKDLTLLGGDSRNPATIKLFLAPPDDGKTPRKGSLTFRGNPENGPTAISLQGIVFKASVDPSVMDDPLHLVALSFRQSDRIEIDGCAFHASKKTPEEDPVGAMLGIIGRSNPPEVMIHNSYFSPGNVAIRSLGRNRIKLLECGFSPHQAIIQIQSPPGSESPQEKGLCQIRIEHCTAFLQGGAVVEIGDQLPGLIQAGYNLFSMPEVLDESQAVVIRQVGERSTETRFEAKLDSKTSPNGYHHVLPYEDQQVFTFEECKKNKIPVSDPQARTIHQPWNSDHPLAWLDEDLTQARGAFQSNLKKSQLRVSDRRPLLGLNAFLGARLYELPLPKPEDEPRLADNQKAWEPNLPANAAVPPGVYRNFGEALANVQKGETLLLRFNGLKEIDPVLFSKLDMELTLKPDENFKPILGLNKSTEAVMFNLKGGKITFDGLQFALSARTGRSLVAMPRGGECHFQNCVITLEEDGAALSVVTLTEPSGEMMMMPATGPEPRNVIPKIQFLNSFLRGRGRLLHVKGSRTFDLEVKNSLAVLDGILVEIDPTSVEPANAPPAQIKLHQMTAYLSSQLLHLQGNARQTEGKGVGLVRTNLQVTNCVLMPASSTNPLILMDRVDSENQMKELLTWEGSRNNLYGFLSKQEILKIQPENTEGMMPKKFERDEWLTYTSESAKSFSAFKFAYQAPEIGKPFSHVRKVEFVLQPLDPLPKLEEGASYGASISNLPAVTEVEAPNR